MHSDALAALPLPVPVPAPTLDQPGGLLATLLSISLTAVALLRPQYAAEGTLSDFTWAYLNPAGQRMLQQPQEPAASLLTLFPHAQQDGVFEKCCRAFLTGEAQRNDTYYQADGLDGYFQLTAQRSGELLVVNFTDTHDHPRTPAEQALRANQAREQAALAEVERQRGQLYHLLEQAPAMICVFDGPQHVFEFVNPPYQALVGERPLLGKPIAEAMPELAGQPIFGLLDQVYRTGETFHAHEMLVQLDHRNESRAELEKHYYNFIYQARRDAAGAIDGILVFAYDVTPQVLTRQQVEHLNAELEARVQERTQLAALQSTRLTRLIQEAPAAIAQLAGPDLVFELLNADYQALFPGRDLLGRPVLEALPELLDTPLAEALRAVYRTGVSHSGQQAPIPFQRPDGAVETRYFDFVYQARYTSTGTIDGLLIFGFEVTAAVHARQAVDATRRELQLVTDALPVLIGYLDRERRYQFANEAYRAWFNQDPHLLLGRYVRDVVGEKPYAATSGYMDRALAGERLDFEARMPYREGFVKHIRTSYIPDVRAGEVVGFYTLVLDITEQVEARERGEASQRHTEGLLAALQNTNAELTRVNADLDHFIYTASHDLKAPIVNIEGLLQVLGEELALPATEADTATVLRMMQDAVQRFQHTLGQLTDVTKLQLLPAPVVPVDVRAVVAGIELDLQPLLTVSGGRVALAPDSYPTLLLPEKHVRSLLYNFISNGLKYRHPHRAPLVQVQCQANAHATVLEVRDNGLGLTPAQQQAVFGLFQRQHSHVEGTGVGLYLVKQLVEGLGGRVELESQPGEGSTFRVVLPLTSATISPAAS